MGRPISEEEFDDLLRTFERSAFHMETQPSYAMGYERADFERFLAGSPVPPPEVGWWKSWLDQITKLTRRGKRISRVRVLEEPPTDYQRWLIWADPWHAAAGEDIRYMPRSKALLIGLPLTQDWWLLDDRRVIVTWFTNTGEIRLKILLTNPAAVASYRPLRDLAIAHATPAGRIAAA